MPMRQTIILPGILALVISLPVAAHAQAKLFPGHGPKSAKYKVQFDDSKKADPKAAPQIVTSLGSAF